MRADGTKAIRGNCPILAFSPKACFGRGKEQGFHHRRELQRRKRAELKGMSITSLSLNNFTAFRDASFEFSPGVNVLVGANATGKSHVMKLAYACLRTVEKGLPSALPHPDGFAVLGHRLGEKLAGVFMPDGGKIDRLVRRPPVAVAEDQPKLAEVQLSGSFSDLPLKFRLGENSRRECSELPDRRTAARDFPARTRGPFDVRRLHWRL